MQTYYRGEIRISSVPSRGSGGNRPKAKLARMPPKAIRRRYQRSIAITSWVLESGWTSAGGNSTRPRESAHLRNNFRSGILAPQAQPSS